MKPAIYVAIIGRFAAGRQEIAREMDKLRSEFDGLAVLDYDMNKISTIKKESKLAIVDLERWVPSDELALTELSESGYEGPIIVLTKRLNESASAGYTEGKVIFLDRAKNKGALGSIARRMILGSLIAARKHPRHPTNETADVKVDGGSKFYTCKVRNMSKGGALLELDTAFSIKVGDNVTVKIKLAQVNRQYSVKARIAWIKMPTFGVEFIGDPI